MWILVEDSPMKTIKMKQFLEFSKLPFVHLNEVTPNELRIEAHEKSWSKPRGVPQRNKALGWLHDHPEQLHHAGVVYFADDDNSYDVIIVLFLFFFLNSP